jgi:ABC-type multidrug transport system fused ATPase/permease subunit
MREPSILRYYVRELQLVLRRPATLFRFALASAMHAFGHALLALVAGGLVVALARVWGPGGASSGPGVDVSSLSDRAFLLTGIGLAVVSLKGAAGVYATYVQGRVAGEVGGSLRLALLDSLLASHRLRRPRQDDHGLPGGPPPAHAVAALTERVHEVELGLKLGLLGGARAVAQLAPLALVLVALSPRMAVVAIVVLGGFGALLGRLRAGYQRATAKAAREREDLAQAADEAVRHADLWVTYGAEAKARSTVRGLGQGLARGTARLEARAAALSGANEVLGAGALVLAVAASRAGWLGAVASGETLLAFAVAFFLAYRPLRELAEARLALARAEGAYLELQRAIGQRIAPAPDLGRRDWPSGVLELRDLRLAYGACAPLSLRVEPGSIVAIAGATGIGKTTLLRTLLGLDRAEGGAIVFDGVSLDDAPAGPAARPFAWVPQDAPLLADTLEVNVALGAPADTPGDAHAALHPLGATHLAGELNGARLGAGGRVVSGGERQWIALARAIATRQPVLLLDEPTSGLDADAQRRVLDAIVRLRGRRTVLIVTHRPEPLVVADAVVRLEAS